ncbi:MAG TPA: enoyl-CoA hydratase/isomerase family protein [Pyrinomonadaceae bacterium]|nr:enoyl-CoA hydratase/isomerase family protein [Pyrinomonadaceae bacterium]HMP65711.1 enoyl-CoA hydratase/isomerase family protein [Pyrinomonadaceae bacterium]
MSNPLRIEDRGNALIICFDRSKQRNPLSSRAIDTLEVAVSKLGAHIEKVIFTGTDGVFASGADLNEIEQLTPEAAPAFSRRGQHLMERIAELPQRTIAAVNGLCYGGGLDLALACDRRIASPNAVFCHPGAGLGIITGWGGTQRLPRLIGQANALEMFFTGTPIDAARAYKIGLIDEIDDDPLVRALEQGA